MWTIYNQLKQQASSTPLPTSMQSEKEICILLIICQAFMIWKNNETNINHSKTVSNINVTYNLYNPQKAKSLRRVR